MKRYSIPKLNVRKSLAKDFSTLRPFTNSHNNQTMSQSKTPRTIFFLYSIVPCISPAEVRVKSNVSLYGRSISSTRGTNGRATCIGDNIVNAIVEEEDESCDNDYCRKVTINENHATAKDLKSNIGRCYSQPNTLAFYSKMANRIKREYAVNKEHDAVIQKLLQSSLAPICKVRQSGNELFTQKRFSEMQKENGGRTMLSRGKMGTISKPIIRRNCKTKLKIRHKLDSSVNSSSGIDSEKVSPNPKKDLRSSAMLSLTIISKNEQENLPVINNHCKHYFADTNRVKRRKSKVANNICPILHKNAVKSNNLTMKKRELTRELGLLNDLEVLENVYHKLHVNSSEPVTLLPKLNTESEAQFPLKLSYKPCAFVYRYEPELEIFQSLLSS